MFLEKKKRPSREMAVILGSDADTGKFQLSDARCQGVFVCRNAKCSFLKSYQVAHQAVGTFK